MEELKKPLAMGLIGHTSGVVYAQMEIYVKDDNTLDIIVRRNAYSRLADVEFSIDHRDLDEIIEVLSEAKGKLDSDWLSKYGKAELAGRRDATGKLG